MPGPLDVDPQRRKLVLTAVFLGAAGAALGVSQWVRAKLREGRPSGLNIAFPTLAPPVSAPRQQPQPEEDGVKLLADTQEGMSEFDKLLGLFGQLDANPAAKEFGKAVMAQPDLRAIYEAFAADQTGPEPTMELADAMQQLNDKREFRQLLAKFGSDPGFRQAVSEFRSAPVVRAALKKEEARIAKVVAAKGRATRGAAGSSLLGPSARVARPGPNTGSGGPSAVAGGSAAGGGGSAERIAGKAGNAAYETSQAHDAPPKLAEVAGAGEDREAIEAFRSLCLRGDPRISKQDCSEISEHLGDFGLWESCAKADRYPLCKNICESNQEPKIDCGLVPDYQTACAGAGISDCGASSGASPGARPGGGSGRGATGKSAVHSECERYGGMWTGTSCVPDPKVDARIRAQCERMGMAYADRRCVPRRGGGGGSKKFR